MRTVVRRFGSKESLFGAVSRERAASIRRARDEVPAGDVSEAVRLLVGTYEDWGDEVLHLLSQERGLTGVANTVEAGRKYHAAWVERTFSPLLGELPALDPGQAALLLDGLARAIDEAGGAPVLLVSGDVRRAVRLLVAPRYPRLQVLAYDELTPEQPVRPVGRLALVA